MWYRFNINGFQFTSGHICTDPIWAGTDSNTRLTQFFQHHFKFSRISITAGHITTAYGGCYQKGAGFYAIWQYLMLATMQGFDTFNHYGIGTGTAYFCAHGIEINSQVDHFRFTCGILYCGATLRQHSGHHQVFCAGHTHHIHDDMRTFQAAGTGFNIAIFHHDIGTHFT